MKYIFANLKRFDIPVELDGINRLAPAAEWGTYLTEQIQKTMKEFEEEAQFGIFYPEAYLIQAAAAKEPGSRWKIGAQGIYREDVLMLPGGEKIAKILEKHGLIG